MYDDGISVPAAGWLCSLRVHGEIKERSVKPSRWTPVQIYCTIRTIGEEFCPAAGGVAGSVYTTKDAKSITTYCSVMLDEGHRDVLCWKGHDPSWYLVIGKGIAFMSEALKRGEGDRVRDGGL